MYRIELATLENEFCEAKRGSSSSRSERIETWFAVRAEGESDTLPTAA
jgi:hypothetical protein